MGDGALGGEENHEVKVARAIFIRRVGIEKVRSASFFGSRLPDPTTRMGQRSVRVNPFIMWQEQKVLLPGEKMD